ncbi:MAG: hypothetical protein UT17_C0017G0011 [Candidatus Woesebacteria bacterium GW2011_GWB1_39_10]|uniref:Uncharacterized protein n=1 Tax=Candidatus Woesebacteria bacterium GW2011_GWB1_39_10 TaxID=1618572 RepID=A0A0G0LH09_9BACT|nr:MAG: hypothetical protein UT17_C0017G0011 [Candidatus Woesebacteria bacterium GW2011_GWB1_39_10]
MKDKKIILIGVIVFIAIYLFASVKCNSAVIFSPETERPELQGTFLNPSTVIVKETEYYYYPVNIYVEKGRAKKFKTKSNAVNFCVTNVLWL